MTENSNILIYQNENGNIKVDVRFEDDSIWKNYDVAHYNLNKDVSITKNYLNKDDIQRLK